MGGVASFLVVNRTDGKGARVAVAAGSGAGRVRAALATLDAEIVRRFHDRQNVNFGYDRMVPDGRLHIGPLPGLYKNEAEIGTPKTRSESTHPEVLAEDGKWHAYEDWKDLFVSETAEDKAAMAALGDEGEDVVFFTASSLGGAKPEVRGPAHVRVLGPTGPSREQIERTLTALKMGSREIDGWNLTATPMIADREDCVKCHTAKNRGEARKVGDTVGWIIRGTRTVQPW